MLFNWSTFQQTYKELPQGQDVYNTFFKVGDRVDKLYGSAFGEHPTVKLLTMLLVNLLIIRYSSSLEMKMEFYLGI